MSTDRPVIGVMLGDRHGIGPEIAARLLADAGARAAADVVLVADPAVAEFGRRVAGVSEFAVQRVIDRPGPAGEAVGSGQISAAAGAEVLGTLADLLELGKAGKIDGIVFAPLNKAAMRRGGLAEGDELDFVLERLGFEGNTGELNVLGNLWTSRVTSHVALRDVADLVTPKHVWDAIALAHDTLVAAGFPEPRIAVAGLNPHAGDGGTFGDEEIKTIAPAIEKARAAGIEASGPYPSDTVFVRAKDGAFDAVVTMYHDQGQVAMKLMGFGKGVTVLGGLPFPITTAGHGTAYDIAGRGIARPDGMFEAFRICTEMARAKRKGRVHA